jgi:uncharacterized membrane protein
VESIVDALSAFLLKHPTGELAQGDFIFSPVVPFVPLVLAVVALIGLTIWAVNRLRGTSSIDRFLLTALRAAVFLLVGFCLLRPTLVLSRAVAQRNVLAVVLDDTRSMAIKDARDGSRTEAVQEVFGDSTALMRALRERFAVRIFRATSDAMPIAGASQLSVRGTRTDLSRSIGGVRDALADMPLAGIVVVSDGAQNGTGDLEAELSQIVARGIPVHTVGVGTERFTTDIGVDAVRLPREVLLGGEAPGEVLLRLRGVGGQSAILTIDAGGRLVGVDTVPLARDREMMVVPIRVPALEAGTLPVRVSVAPLEGEVTTVNNHASAVLRIREGPEKILYVEGEPRPELAFLRRAVDGDSALRVVALIRTARDKHLRLGVDDSLELVNGFPVRREELFKYRAIVLGSVEAGYFDRDQLRMLQDFVGVRGGGLLALGGRSALAEGGFAGTPLDEVLPLVLDPAMSGRDNSPVTYVSIQPTSAGSTHAALQLPDSNITGWSDLPPLTTVNAPGKIRPGATVLLSGGVAGVSIPVFTSQRYGRGHSAVFLPQDLWRWQMRKDAPEGDVTQPALWNRILRWTVAGVPEQVELDAQPGLTAPGEPVELRARVTDSSFAPRDDARVTVRVVPPDAPAWEVPLQPDLAAAGEYTGQFIATSEGAHRLEMVAVRGGDTLETTGLVVSDLDRGDAGPVERDNQLLAQVADRTGGNQYDIFDVEDLPDDVLLTTSGITARASNDLWDAPLIFLLFVLLLGLDWGWRRHRGLA